MKKAWIPTTLISCMGLCLAAGLLWGCQDFLNNSDKSAAPGKEPDTTSELVGKTAAILSHHAADNPRTHCAALYEHENGQGGTYFVSPGSKGWVGPEWNDRMSSVTVAKGCGITLYVDSEFRGSHRTYMGPKDEEQATQKLYPSFGTGLFGYNDVFSSYSCDCEGMAIGNNAGTAWDEVQGKGNARKILWYGPGSVQSMVPLKFNDRPEFIVVNPNFDVIVWKDVSIEKGRAVGSGGGQKVSSSQAVNAPLRNGVSLIGAYRTAGCNNPHACYRGESCNPMNYMLPTASAERCWFVGGFSWCSPGFAGGPSTCEVRP